MMTVVCRFWLLFFLLLCPFALADSYGYQFGLITDYTVTPGSQVAVDAFLKNTGTLPIIFAPAFDPTKNNTFIDQGGITPGYTYGNEGDWLIPDYGLNKIGGSTRWWSDQFAGVIVNSGETFAFTYLTFTAPLDQPIGSSALAANADLWIWFDSNIYGSLYNIRSQSGSYAYGNLDRPTLTFVLGNETSATGLSWYSPRVINTVTGELLSGPVGSATIPEPGSLLLFGTFSAALLSQSGKRKN